MKMKQLMTLAAFGLAASASTAFAQAENSYAQPWQGDFWRILGVGVGQSKIRSDCVGNFTCDNRDTAWKIYAGGRWSRYFGLEFGYNDFGKVDQSGGRTKAFAANITFTAGVPLGDRFDIFAKGGGAYGRTEVSADPSTGVATGTKSNFEGTYGVGASYAVTRNWQIRADWDRYNLDFVGQGHQNVDMATASVQYRF
jgi:opacity protein-like surface antigen